MIVEKLAPGLTRELSRESQELQVMIGRAPKVTRGRDQEKGQRFLQEFYLETRRMLPREQFTVIAKMAENAAKAEGKNG